MTRLEKLRRKLRNSPTNVTMREFETLSLHGKKVKKVKKVYVRKVSNLLDTLLKMHRTPMMTKIRTEIPTKMAISTNAIDYYMSLPYTLEVIPDDGAWFVQIPELPGCMTEVDEWDEILPAIEDAKRLWLELALERARDIPEPTSFSS